MKYFTIDNWIADQDLSQEPLPTHLAGREYQRYFDFVRDRLPQSYLGLVKEWYLHDSTLTSLEIDHASQRARLILASWKHDRSGGVLSITYSGLARVRAESDSEKGLPGPNGFGDLGYDEIEVLNDDLFEHRILFSSGIELTFQFVGLAYAEVRGA